MLRVKTRVAPSTIQGAGLGCFAAQDIPAGTVTWVEDPMFDKHVDFDYVESLLGSEVADILRSYAYRLPDCPHLTILCADNARFINHCPESRNIGHPGGDHVPHIEVALRDIAEGEELFSDYSRFDLLVTMSQDWTQHPSIDREYRRTIAEKEKTPCR